MHLHQRQPQLAAVPPATFSHNSPDLTRPAFAEHAARTAVAEAEAQVIAAKSHAKAASSSKDRRAADREAKAAERRAIAARRALEAEQAAEEMCPAAQRNSGRAEPVRDSDGKLVSYRRSSVLRTLQKKSPLFTERLIAAGEAYAAAAETLEAGIVRSCVTPMSMSASPSSGNTGIENAVGAGVRLEQMRQAVGVFCTGLLDHVAVQNMPLPSWAAAKKVNQQTATGMLFCALDRLADHLHY
ncbi:Hypothetical protein GbCGDNIH2_7301 [Granulibacter bethesdensis]|nr:Hypothetical protein GbCGDNIH2_7301 [Granulibacter bethesdensis]